MGGPDMAPHAPPALDAPRETRGAPRDYAGTLARMRGPDLAPHAPPALGAPRETRARLGITRAGS